MDAVSSREESGFPESIEVVGQLPQAPQEEFSLRNMYVKGTLCFLLQVKWTLRFPDSKKGRISLQSLNAGSSFISQYERMSESPVDTLQKALGLHLISTRGLISICHLGRHAEFRAPKLRMPDSS